MTTWCKYAVHVRANTHRCQLGLFGGMPHMAVCRKCLAGYRGRERFVMPAEEEVPSNSTMSLGAACIELKEARSMLLGIRPDLKAWCNTREETIFGLSMSPCARSARACALVQEYRRLVQVVETVDTAKEE